MKAPLVSVILPVAGPSSYLHDAIDSILQQTLQDFELLLITYPYTKQSAPIWLSELQDDKRIQCMQRTQAGLVSALNTGITAARGRYIARMDADDLAMPERLEHQLNYLLNNNENSIIGANVEIFNASETLLDGNRRYQNWLNSVRTADQIKRNLLVESPLPHPTWFAQTEVFRVLGGYRDCAWAEDYDFLLRADLAGIRMGKPDQVLLRWRDHSDRLTHKDERYSRLNFTRAKAWSLANSLAKNRSVIILGTGRNAVRLYDALKAEGVSVEAFVEHAAARQRTSRRHLPVLSYAQLEQNKPDALMITAVTANGARDNLRNWFKHNNYVELEDYVIAG